MWKKLLKPRQQQPALRQFLVAFTAVLLFGILLFGISETLSKGPESEAGKKLAAVKAAEKENHPPLPLGTVAPNFILPDMAQHDVSLFSFRGKKYVLLEFFATWCPHCQHSVPALSAFASAHQDKIQVLAINAGDRPPQRSTSADFIQAFGATYTILEEPSDELLAEYKLYGFPLLYLIDKEGKIVWTHEGTLTPEAVKALEAFAR